MDILKNVEKPGRYTGGELNSVYKENAKINFALCFADVYEVGMSHLGIGILYETLNAYKDIYAQRVFCPWVDMLEELVATNMPLTSLEQGVPLKDFDIVGINLSYEMCYTNVLVMLDAGKIPLLAKDRAEDFPIIVGGGACTVNPEPLADFFDIFVIGEGEEVSVKLCETYITHKEKGFNKGDFLEDVAQIRGVYVPSLYNVEYNEDSTVKCVTPTKNAPSRVKKCFIEDFEHIKSVTKPVLPYISVIHDRCVTEIMRGCSNGCRFCQAGYIMRPVRTKSMAEVKSNIKKVIEATGYEEISLSSLSAGDYPQISELVWDLIEEYKDKKVSVSLPSMRMDNYMEKLSEALQQIRKTGLTFAPEAGSQHLRDIINKNITEEEILSTVKKAFESGVNSVKLYFMIGLPNEKQEDLEEIVSLVKKIKEAFYDTPKEKRSGYLNITVSASNFVPKANTPFMWEGQDTIESFKEKQRYLKENLRIKGIKFNYHDAYTSYLESVFARGDRRLSKVILTAYNKGAKFDAWREFFSFNTYKEAFLECGIDPQFYANRVRSEAEVFPFEHIDYLVSKEFLLKEKEKAKQAITTKDCFEQCCGCGLQKEGCRKGASYEGAN